MSGVRGMLHRVARLEAARIPRPSPIDIEAFAADTAGLDPIDFPLVIEALRRWERDHVWAAWHRGRNHMWETSMR